MTTGKKFALGVVIFFGLLMLALIIIVPLLIDVDRYRPQVVAHIREETGKPAEIGHLALSLFPRVSIRVDDFALGNPAGFPEGHLIKVHRISVQLDASALWDRQILIKSLELDEPVVSLLSDVRGRWNFENPPQAKALKEASRADPPLFTLGVISNVSIGGGQLAASNLLPSGRPGPNFFEGRNVSIRLQHVDLNAFAGATSASVVPRSGRSPLMSLAEWWTSIAYAATSSKKPAARGTLRAETLRFGTLEATAVKTGLRLYPKQVFFDDLSFDLYGGHAAGELSFDLAGKNPRYSTSARLTDVDVARLLGAFPDARGKMTGKMEGNMKLSGEVSHSPDPLAGMRGAGQVSVRNGKLPTLQLNKNLMLLTRLSNLGPTSGDPSSFSSVSADLNIANEQITSNKITIMGNGVDVDGRGTLVTAGEGSLNYEGVAKLVAAQNALTDILTSFTGAKVADGKLTFPFNIAGTLQVPRFTLKSAGGRGGLGGLQNVLAGGGERGTQQPGQTLQQPGDLVQGITDLFKKKQSQPQQPAPKQ